MEYNDSGSYRRKPKKKRKNRSLMWVVIGFIIIILMFSAGYVLIHKYLPNSEVESVYENNKNLNEDTVNIMMGDSYLSPRHKPLIDGGVVYLPADFVKDELDPYVFWEPDSDKLTITTLTKVIAMRVKKLDYFVNDKPVSLTLPVVREGGMAYIPQSFVTEMYNINVRHEEKYNMVIIDKKETGMTTSELIKKTELRFEPDIKSAVAEKLEEGAGLVLYEETEDFIRVRTDDGLIGYVKTKFIGERTEVEPVLQSPEETPPRIAMPPGKIVLLWDQVFDAKSAADPKKHQPVPTVNVLSPTWFSFDEEGEDVTQIINIGDMQYVQAAHANGYQVWPLITDNFSSSVSHEILTVAENRESVIKQILAFTAMYDVDGINIDFEAVREADAPYYLQFLRELNPFLKMQNVILSVDMFVPLYTRYYNRTEVQKVVDYVCVMTYDEHYSGSPTTGPVASLGFVEEGVFATLSEVPKEKILMGLPFYNRVWTEKEAENGEISFKKQDTTMISAYNSFIKNNVEFEWLEDMGYHYGEYKTIEEGIEVTKKVWLEDERSIMEKLKIADKYDVAGVCGWKRGLEKDVVWEYIAEYVKS